MIVLSFSLSFIVQYLDQTFFYKQVRIIKNAICRNCYIMGDFNLDGGHDIRPEYSNRQMLSTLKEFASELNLIQVVNFKTWSRTINGTIKESLLDHVYLNIISTFDSVFYDTPVFGDHLLVIVKLSLKNGKMNNNNAFERN